MVGCNQMRRAGIALFVWCLCGMSVSAHHSTLAFDGTQPTVISGVVATFNWRYPHTSIVLDVSDPEGTITRWTIESESLQMLSRLGWTKILDQARGSDPRDGGPRPEWRSRDALSHD